MGRLLGGEGDQIEEKAMSFGARVRVVGLTGALCVACIAVVAAPARAATLKLSFTGKEQTFKVPKGVKRLHVTAVGGPGGHGGATTNSPGLGGLAIADVAVSPGQLIFIEVGGGGGDGNLHPSGMSAPGGLAGFNGGGVGGI